MRLSASLSVKVLCAPLVALIAFLVCLRRIGDCDYWTHLALGRVYWRGGLAAISEPFVLSRIGQPLENSERLFQILLYPLRTVGSDAAVCLAIALIAAVVFFIFAGFISDVADTGAVAIAFTYLVATIVVVRFRFVPRPEATAYLLLALSLAIARSWRRHPGRGKMAGLAIIFSVWVPLHVTWTIGILLVVILLLTTPRPDFWRAQMATAGGRFFIMAVIAVVILAGFKAAAFGRFILAQMTQGGELTGITEMRPLWEFPSLLRDFCLLAAFALILAWGDREGRGGRLFYWAVAFALGAFVVRNTAIALLGMVPIALEGLGSRKGYVMQRWQAFWVCMSLLIVAALLAYSLRKDDAAWGVGVQWSFFPRDAAAFVKEHRLPGIVFNNWDCGGYLNWAWDGVPCTFLDGRLGDSTVIGTHDAIVDGIDPAAAINSLGIRTILIQPLYNNSGRIVPALFWILKHPEWRLARASDALVFVKGPLPDGVVPLPAYEAWRALRRQIEMMPAGLADDRKHLLYSSALALYFGGDMISAQQVLADAKRKHPELLPEYRGYFLF